MLRKMLRRPEVERITGLSRSSIYAQMNSGTFPRPVRLSVRAVAWPEIEIEEWLQSREHVNKATSR